MKALRILVGLLVVFSLATSFTFKPNVVGGGPQITWPLDFMISINSMSDLATEIHPSNLMQPFQRPVVSGQCSYGYVTSYSDQLFNFEGCKKVLRTWQVLDWCNYPAIYTHVQVIKVIVINGDLEPCTP